MASEPVLSRDVGKRTSRDSKPVIVISGMVGDVRSEVTDEREGFRDVGRNKIK